MEENYLFGLIVVFLFGFVFFKREKNISVNTSPQKHSFHEKASGSTGVAKYLQNQQDALQTRVTGVAKYLQEKEILEVDNSESAISGVAKYLANIEEVPASSVSKYMAKQAVQAKILARENVSGVEKYLNKQSFN